MHGVFAHSWVRSYMAAPRSLRRKASPALLVPLTLHADRYFFDRHVEVSVKDGVVVLRGLVFSDWDLRDALRIARKAAGENLVVNSLTLIQGGLNK
jgi:hypothetical protein